MTTALILSIGSRGDTEPLIALATAMLTHFEKVHILYQADYTSLIPPDPRIVGHQLPFTATDFRPFFQWGLIKSLLLAPFIGLDTVKIQVTCISNLITGVVVPMMPMLMTIAEQINPSLVMSTTLGLSVAATLAEKRDIPYFLVNFQPNTPTAAYPYYMHGTDNAILTAEEIASMHQQPSAIPDKSLEYLKTYNTQYELFTQSLPQLNRFRASYGLKEMQSSHLNDIICGRRSRAHVINSFCKPLVPSSPDHTDNVHIVPPLASDYIPTGWNAESSCPQTVEYLSKGDKPVCVTFGSVGGHVSNAAVTRELFNGLRAAGVKRVLLLNGTTDLGVQRLWRFRDCEVMQWAEEHVFVTTEKPQYAWLFPHCRALVCHGGAGTTFAALRAGVPVVVTPVLCDQFFWGRLLERLQLGAVAGASLYSAKRDSFEKGVRRVLEKEVLERVQRFGEEERKSADGASVAAEVVSSLTRL